MSNLKRASNTRFTILLFSAIAAGAAAGLACNRWLAPGDLSNVHATFDLMSRVFLRLIKMIIAPLVLCTLAAGIARMGSGSKVGGMAARALLIFVAGSLVSLSLGAAAALSLEPGSGLHLVSTAAAGNNAGPVDLSIAGFVDRVIPVSIFEALSSNAILQIVVFALFAGFALAELGTRGERLTVAFEDSTRLMLVVAQHLMRFAPLGVFGATAAAFTVHGLGLIRTYATFVAEFYVLLAVICLLLVALGYLFLGNRVLVLLKVIREPVILAFSTSSSEVAYPKLLIALESFGVAPAIAGFLLPLGYAFNLIGSMAYSAFATIFVAQAFDVHLGRGDIVLMLMMLMVMSKGIANVPRASLIVIAAVLPYFKIPDAGVALILGVDQILDMGRTGTNAVANGIAAASVAGWDGADAK
jgi:Na+/H+-dicarboxylate symporter